MRNLVLLGLCLACFGGTDAAAASFITRCSAEDSKCLKQSSQAAIPYLAAGIPEFKMESLDPLIYEKMDASDNDLKFLLSDVTVLGLKGCVMKSLVRDSANSKIVLKLLCTVKLSGNYEMDGRLIVVPIQGNGKINVVLNKLVINVEANMGEKEKNGVKYWDIKSWKHSFELKDKAEIQLANLFNGNSVLRQAVDGLLVASPNDVVKEVGPVIIKNIVAKVVKNVSRFFHKVPAEELALV